MSNASIIKEFLVALGFKLDKSGQAQMQKGIQSVSASAVALGEIMAKAAEAVGKAVVKMASDLDTLYFTSRRVNAAAENIKAFGFAIEQMGGDAKGAQAALEGIASFMRSNPAGEGFINGLGVATRDANGQLRDTTEILADLGKKFAAMPFYMAKIRAALLGIDEKTLIAIENPDFGKEEGKYKDFAARLGLGMDAGADASNKFAEKVRDLKAEFGLLFIAVASKLLPVFQWLADALSQLPAAFEQFSHSQAGKAFGEVGEAAGELLQTLMELAKVIWRIIGPAIKILVGGDLKVLVDVLHVVRDYLRALNDVLRGDLPKALRDFGHIGYDVMDGLVHRVLSLKAAVISLWRHLTNPNAPDDGPAIPSVPATGLGAPGANPEGSSAGHVPIAANAGASIVGVGKAVRDYLIANGFKADKAQGIAAGVQAEGGTPDAFNSAGGGQGAFGIGQWRGERLRRLRARYGNNPTLAQQLDFLLWELRGGDRGGAAVLAASGAAGTLQAYINDFMRPAGGALGDLQRGSRYLGAHGVHGGASVNQKTDIHISGVHEPVAAGRVVAASQERVNGNLIRNLKTAVA